MSTTITDPISSDWSPTGSDAHQADQPTATARGLSSRLARLEVCEIDVATVPLLAAAAAELALVAGISWRFSTDDPSVALLRVIARATAADPTGGGPHTDRLVRHLDARAASSPTMMI